MQETAAPDPQVQSDEWPDVAVAYEGLLEEAEKLIKQLPPELQQLFPVKKYRRSDPTLRLQLQFDLAVCVTGLRAEVSNYLATQKEADLAKDADTRVIDLQSKIRSANDRLESNEKKLIGVITDKQKSQLEKSGVKLRSDIAKWEKDLTRTEGMIGTYPTLNTAAKEGARKIGKILGTAQSSLQAVLEKDVQSKLPVAPAEIKEPAPVKTETTQVKTIPQNSPTPSPRPTVVVTNPLLFSSFSTGQFEGTPVAPKTRSEVLRTLVAKPDVTLHRAMILSQLADAIPRINSQEMRVLIQSISPKPRTHLDWDIQVKESEADAHAAATNIQPIEQKADAILATFAQAVESVDKYLMLTINVVDPDMTLHAFLLQAIDVEGDLSVWKQTIEQTSNRKVSVHINTLYEAMRQYESFLDGEASGDLFSSARYAMVIKALGEFMRELIPTLSQVPVNIEALLSSQIEVSSESTATKATMFVERIRNDEIAEPHQVTAQQIDQWRKQYIVPYLQQRGVGASIILFLGSLHTAEAIESDIQKNPQSDVLNRLNNMLRYVPTQLPTGHAKTNALNVGLTRLVWIYEETLHAQKPTAELIIPDTMTGDKREEWRRMLQAFAKQEDVPQDIVANKTVAPSAVLQDVQRLDSAGKSEWESFRTLCADYAIMLERDLNNRFITNREQVLPAVDEALELWITLETKEWIKELHKKMNAEGILKEDSARLMHSGLLQEFQKMQNASLSPRIRAESAMRIQLISREIERIFAELGLA